jgi:hypothetical protein
MTAVLCTHQDVSNVFGIFDTVQPFTPALFDAHIGYASSEFASAAKSVYEIDDTWSPLPTDVGGDVNKIVATLAGWSLLCFRGFTADVANDSIFRQMYDDARQRVVEMQDDELHLPLPLRNEPFPTMPHVHKATLVGAGGILPGWHHCGRD